MLEFAGVPWFFDAREQCYRIRADYRFPALALTEDEAMGQAVATARSGAPGLDIGPGAGPTTRKLAVSSPNGIRDLLADASRMIEVIDLKLVDHSRHQDAIRTIQAALLQGRQLHGTYHSPYEAHPRKLTIHAYRLCLIKQAWYVVGRIEGEEDAKTFRVTRFKSVRPLDKPSSVPHDFSLREHFGNAWSVYRGVDSHEVELRFEPEAAKIVTETVWHHTQQARLAKDGRVTLTFRVDGLDEILHWVLGWTGRVTVVRPNELRQRMLASLQSGVAMHD